MKKRFSLFAMIAMICLVYSCDQVFEEDLSGITVETISPKDSAVVDENIQTFWWREIDDIISYRVVIVQPSFSAPEFIVLDTTLTNFQFTQDVSGWDSSRYEWTVFGISGESVTDTVAHPFVVSSGKDLSNDAITLLTPSNGAVLTEADQTFRWAELQDADYYVVIIASPSIRGNDDYELDTIFAEEELKLPYDLSKLDSGSYEWTVLGVSGTNYSDTTIHSFTVPGNVSLSNQQVVLQAPEDNKEFGTNLIELDWETLGGAEYYVIQYDKHIEDLFGSDATEIQRPGGKSGEIEFPENKVEYFWRVRAWNELGYSQYSEIRRIYIDTTLVN